MLITRISDYSQIERTLDVLCTPEQYAAYLSGIHIQVCMADIAEHHREFILSGITSEEWNELFPPENEDYEQHHNDPDGNDDIPF